MKCSTCGKTIEDGSDFCYYCGAVFNEKAVPVVAEQFDNVNQVSEINDVPNVQKRQKTSESNKEAVSNRLQSNRSIADKETDQRKQTSVAGRLIQVLSIIVLILGFIASCIMIDKIGTEIGLAMMAGELLFGLMCFGFGKIICLLTSINSKMK